MRDRVHTHKQPMIECTAYEKNARLVKAIVGDGCEERSHLRRFEETTASQIRTMTVVWRAGLLGALGAAPRRAH